MKPKARNTNGSKKSINGHNRSLHPTRQPPIVGSDDHTSARDQSSSPLLNATPQKSRPGDVLLPRDQHDQTQSGEKSVTSELFRQILTSDKQSLPRTSMETEYMSALYSESSDQGQSHDREKSLVSDYPDDDTFARNAKETEGRSGTGSPSDSEARDYESNPFDEVAGEDGDCEDFEDDLDAYEHDDFLSSQEAILMELRREQVEFEENVRQLQQQLQRQGSLPPFQPTEADAMEGNALGDMYLQDNIHGDFDRDSGDSSDSHIRNQKIYRPSHPTRILPPPTACDQCKDPRPTLCLEKYGEIWKPVIIEALATAAAAIAQFHALHGPVEEIAGEDQSLGMDKRFIEYLPRPNRTSLPFQDQYQHLAMVGQVPHENTLDTYASHGHERLVRLQNILRSESGFKSSAPTVHSNGDRGLSRHPTGHPMSAYQNRTPPITRPVYPLPMDSLYKFGRRSTAFLEPVGEYHEFQSAEGNSRQVLLHVWPPSEADTALLTNLETACRDFQESDIVRGHSGDGFLNGWRPSWKQPHQSGVLRFGHWRVKAPADQGTDLFAPFQTPLTLAAGGGSVLGSQANSHLLGNIGMPVSSSANDGHARTTHPPPISLKSTFGRSQTPAKVPEIDRHKDYPPTKDHGHQHSCQQGSEPSQCPVHGQGSGHHGGGITRIQDVETEPMTQTRLLRLIRAIQMVEKGVIARHLQYLFPTLYEKYHGLQFGTPRLFDAVATVALAMDVSPRLHHDRAHTKHGFCWIVACGDFVGGDLCIPELGKRVVMKPGTVVAIRSTVVAYYVERYAKNTSMYTMYAYTADNCWPPTE